MRYEFPIIENVQQVRDSIKGREEFVEAVKDGYTVFNYLVNFSDTFPKVVDERTAILRECRGLIFNTESGKPISRRYHKFFNLGEKEETQSHNVDFTKNHFMLEKLDGSMITPFRVNGQTLIGTKMGVTGVSEFPEIFFRERENYGDFSDVMIESGKTPIFEWCSRKNRIVIDHPVDRLVLTAIRDNVTGQYSSYEEMSGFAEEFDLDLVRKLNRSFDELYSEISELTDAEGYVLRFEDGHMLKIKGDWYCQIHKNMEHLHFEKDVIRLILDEKVDDLKSFLAPDLSTKLDEFGSGIFHNILSYSERVAWESIEDYDRSSSKKQYASVVSSKSDAKERFMIYDFMANETSETEKVLNYSYEIFMNKVKNSLTTATKVDNIRTIIGNLRWIP